MKKNKGDEQMEMIGQFFISFFKVCASGLKKTIRTVPLLILLIVVIAVTITVMLNQDKLISIWNFFKIIYVFLTIFLYLLKCPQSLILSALRAFCFCGKPHISRSIFLYFRYQAWLKSW